MNKTQNYNLNQWSKDDRVLMEDFNADNAKIDAAIKAQADGIAAERSARISAVQAARDAYPLVTLRSVTLTSSVSQYDLPLTGFNWEDYGEVIIYMMLKCVGSAGTLKVLLNNVEGNNRYYDHNTGPTYQLRSLTIYDSFLSFTCRVTRASSGFFSGWSTSGDRSADNAYSSRDSYPRSQYTTMNFICDKPLAAGCRFTILGIRA